VQPTLFVKDRLRANGNSTAASCELRNRFAVVDAKAGFGSARTSSEFHRRFFPSILDVGRGRINGDWKRGSVVKNRSAHFRFGSSLSTGFNRVRIPSASFEAALIASFYVRDGGGVRREVLLVCGGRGGRRFCLSRVDGRKTPRCRSAQSSLGVFCDLICERPRFRVLGNTLPAHDFCEHSGSSCEGVVRILPAGAACARAQLLQ